MSEAESIGDEASIRRQSRARLDRLYRRYSSWLEARLRRRYGADAEDIVQDAWLKIAPMEATLDIRHPKAFLLTFATNLARSRARQAHRRSELLALNLPNAPVGLAGGQAEAVELEDLILGLPQPLRDRIVVGEMRDGAAVLETLKSWNTGHPGGLSTIHANSSEDVLRRLEDLAAEVTAQPPRRAIGQSVDRIIHIARTPEGRRVQAIQAVEGLEGETYRMARMA